MNKKIYTILIVSALFGAFSFVHAVTKPGPDANVDNFSYAFFLYYDNGQLFADRDYEIKYDVIEEPFTAESPNSQAVFKVDISNYKSEIVKTFNFDPKKGDANFKAGKIVVKGPYVSDGQRVRFYNSNGDEVLTIFVEAGSICDDDGSCNPAAGENEKTCSNDCKKPRITPTPPISEETSGFLGGFDLNSILIYVVGTLGVGVIVWFGWKWWKKKRGESFLPPQSPSAPINRPIPPPPMPPSGFPPVQ